MVKARSFIVENSVVADGAPASRPTYPISEIFVRGRREKRERPGGKSLY